MPLLIDVLETSKTKPKRHPKCLGYHYYDGEFDCGYSTNLMCEDCKYGGCGGRKDPSAKCNAT